MTYGLNRDLFLENGAAIHAASVASMRSSSRFLAWRKLDSERRLAAIEQALKAPANDVVDGYPLAL